MTKTSQHHSFDIELASLYGIQEAILIHHFQHWIRVNQKLKRNFHDGRTWTYQTLDEIAAHFPYLSRSEVFEIIERLCAGKGRRSKKEKGFEPVLKKGNYNKKKFDKTCWYSFENEEMFTVLAQAKMDSGSSQRRHEPEPTPIPDTIPDTKTDLPPPLGATPEEEEEELNRRFKERPKGSPKITSRRKWNEAVLIDIRREEQERRAQEESTTKASQAEDLRKQTEAVWEAELQKRKTSELTERVKRNRDFAQTFFLEHSPSWMKIEGTHITLTYSNKIFGQCRMGFEEDRFAENILNFDPNLGED